MSHSQNPFKIVSGFLRQFEAEVQGRGTEAPDAASREMLLRFSEGKCSAEERKQVCEVLRQNPEWLNLLAKEVKGRRKDS